MIKFCPLCLSKNFTLKGYPKTNSISSKFIFEDYKVVQCSHCELYYVSPTIDFSDEQWEELYNSKYFARQSEWLVKVRQKELIKRFDIAENFISNKNSIVKFLDVGVGEGKALLEGHRRGWQVSGIDIVDNRISNAKIPEIEFINANLLESELPENYYDFIYVDSVLEHVLNPLEYLIKIKKILRNRGIVYIGVPNEDSLFNDVRRIVFRMTGKKNLCEKIKPFDSPYHVVGFNRNSLNYLIEKTNLEVKKMRNFGRKLDFLGYRVNSKEFWISFFFLFPFEYIGKIFQRDVYFEAYLTKYKSE